MPPVQFRMGHVPITRDNCFGIENLIHEKRPFSVGATGVARSYGSRDVGIVAVRVYVGELKPSGNTLVSSFGNLSFLPASGVVS